MSSTAPIFTDRPGLPPAPLYTIDEAAQIANVGRRTLLRRIAEGALPVIRLGGATRIHPDDLAAYFAAHRTIGSPP